MLKLLSTKIAKLVVDVDIVDADIDVVVVQVVLCFEEGTAQLPPPVRDFRFSRNHIHFSCESETITFIFSSLV